MKKGRIEAFTEKEVAEILSKSGLIPLEIKRETNFLEQFEFLSKLKGVSGREIAVFTRMLATMLSSGLTLNAALSNLANQTRNAQLQGAIEDIIKRVSGGSSFSEALAFHKGIFNNLYVSLVKAGEASGKLEETLIKLAETLETKEEFSGKVKGAMVYPGIVITMMLIISVIMMVVVIPRITQVYIEFGADLPLPTKILVFVSNVFVNYGVFFLPIIFGLFFVPRLLKKYPRTAKFYNNFIYRLPVMGELQKEVSLTIFCRTFGSLIGSGVPISRVLQISAEILGENDFRDAILECREKIEKGFALSESLRRFPLFPPILPQMVSMGEETGKLDEAMFRLSLYFAELADRRSKTLTAAMEPILVICLGIGVGGLALAILLPLFNLVSVIK